MERFVYGDFTYCNFPHIKLRHGYLSTDITIFSKQQTPKPSRKVAIPEEKLSNGSKQASTACVRLMYESEIFRSSPQATFPKFTVVFETFSCNMYLIHSYASLQLSKSFPL